MKLNSITLMQGRPRGRSQSRLLGGTTLVEMMVGMLLFALVSVGLTISLIQQLRQGENGVSMVASQVVAESILEQVRRVGFSKLSDFTAAAASAPTDYPSSTVGTFETATNASGSTYTTYRGVELKFIGVGGDNYATVQAYNLYWAADATTFVEVGERAVEGNAASAVYGVVLDMDHISTAGTLLRSRRYMKMQVNITRTLNDYKDTVEICLRYKWAVPDRRTGTGDLIYYSTREIRAIVSKIPTY